MFLVIVRISCLLYLKSKVEVVTLKVWQSFSYTDWPLWSVCFPYDERPPFVVDFLPPFTEIYLLQKTQRVSYKMQELLTQNGPPELSSVFLVGLVLLACVFLVCLRSAVICVSLFSCCRWCLYPSICLLPLTFRFFKDLARNFGHIKSSTRQIGRKNVLFSFDLGDQMYHFIHLTLMLFNTTKK